jgi:hypothetical protein
MKVLLLILIFHLIVRAQTISPVIVECGIPRCAGEFTITNNQVKPLVVSLEAYSVEVIDGKPVSQPLAQSTTVQLSETAARVGPKARHTFSYKLICDKGACNTRIAAVIVMGRTKDGVLVRVALPEVIYSCAHQGKCRDAVLAQEKP